MDQGNFKHSVATGAPRCPVGPRRAGGRKANEILMCPVWEGGVMCGAVIVLPTLVLPAFSRFPEQSHTAFVMKINH